MARPINQLSQEGAKGGGDRFDPQKAAPPPINAEQEEWSGCDLLQHTLPTHNGGTMYVQKCNLAQFPVTLRLATSSLYATNLGALP